MTKKQIKMLIEVLSEGEVLGDPGLVAEWGALKALVSLGVLEVEMPEDPYAPFSFRLASRAYERKRPTVTAE